MYVHIYVHVYIYIYIYIIHTYQMLPTRTSFCEKRLKPKGPKRYRGLTPSPIVIVITK